VRALLLLVLLLPVLASAAASPNQRQAKEAELLQLRERISALRKELDQVRTRYDALRNELRDVEAAIAKNTQTLQKVDAELTQKTRHLAELREQQDKLMANITRQRGYLSQQIRAAHALGRQEYLKLLLNQENPATLGRALAYYDYLNRSRAERIGTAQTTLQNLAEVQQGIEDAQQRLIELRNAQRLQHADLKKSRASRSDLLAELERELSSKDQRLKAMLSDEKALEKLILALTQALEDIPPELDQQLSFAQLRGKLPWPVKGKITASYGSQRLGSLRWQGVMLTANEGQPVHAVAGGRVAFADWMRGFGYLLILDHGNGYMSLYGNNQSLHKDVGDWVRAGEVLASSGSSGGSNRSGVYFEIRYKGKPQDPVRWCRR